MHCCGFLGGFGFVFFKLMFKLVGSVSGELTACNGKLELNTQQELSSIVFLSAQRKTMTIGSLWTAANQ